MISHSQDMSFSDKQLYILRHGETDFNRFGIVQGSGVDSALNQTGRKQARAFYDKYMDHKFDLVVCSTLQRSYQTIAPFLDHGIPLEKYAEIDEINWGVHEGKKGDEALIRDYKDVVRSWSNGDFYVSVEEGESAQALAERVSAFLERIYQREEEKILICSHGRTLRCMICLIKGEPISNMENYTHDNTGLNIINYRGGEFFIESHNDISHLDGLNI